MWWDENMKIKRINVGLTTIILLAVGAFFTRFWELGAAAFGADYMDFYKLALRNQNIIEFWKNPPWLNQIPLNETLTLLLIKIGLPATPFVVRIPFALMSILALFSMGWFAWKQFGRSSAKVVLVLGIFNPFYLYFSRTSYHYAGAACWSMVLFLTFWNLEAALKKKEVPVVRDFCLWFAVAILACHMHMSVWVVVGLQGAILLSLGVWAFRRRAKEFRSFLIRLGVGAILLVTVMSRWIYRAVSEILRVSGGGGHHFGADAGSEFKRLLPSFFAGENSIAVILLVVFVSLSVVALSRKSTLRSRYRTFFGYVFLHFLVLMLYIGVVGGGIAKITYFSPVWPLFILAMGIGATLGVDALVSRSHSLRVGLKVLLSVAYLALVAVPDWAIIHLEGKPEPYYKINKWVDSHLPSGTPVLVDHWLDPWNGLALHNPGGLQYTFTVPNVPLEAYYQNNWRKTAEQFFEKFPSAALLEVDRGSFVDRFGPWEFPTKYFARTEFITNAPAMTLRRFKVFPTHGYAKANTNGIVVQISYNTIEDLVVAARKNGRDVLRLYSEGWGYAKPGWQQGHFEDYRVFSRAASLDIYNLKEVPLTGSIEISAATSDRPKTISVNGSKTVFAAGRIRTWKLPLTLQPGKNTIPFTSPSADPLFVLDIRWVSTP